MHELSLARTICGIVADHAGGDRLADVVTVGVEVGDRAGVEVRSLEFCLTVLLGAPPFGRARPVIEVRPGADLRVTRLEVEDGGPAD